MNKLHITTCVVNDSPYRWYGDFSIKTWLVDSQHKAYMGSATLSRINDMLCWRLSVSMIRGGGDSSFQPGMEESTLCTNKYRELPTLHRYMRVGDGPPKQVSTISRLDFCYEHFCEFKSKLQRLLRLCKGTLPNWFIQTKWKIGLIAMFFLSLRTFLWVFLS